MTITKVLVAAAVLLSTVAAVPAFAHDDDEGYTNHWQFHDNLSDAHRRAHEEGFSNWAEHRAYHRALRDLHEQYHDDNPRAYYGYRNGWSPYYSYGWRRHW